jgi:hypothetical protein
VTRVREAELFNGRSGRPFGARFSWTVDLPWDPPVTIAEGEDGRLKLHDHETGALIATTKPGVSPELAMLELRALLY